MSLCRPSKPIQSTYNGWTFCVLMEMKSSCSLHARGYLYLPSVLTYKWPWYRIGLMSANDAHFFALIFIIGERVIEGNMSNSDNHILIPSDNLWCACWYPKHRIDTTNLKTSSSYRQNIMEVNRCQISNQLRNCFENRLQRPVLIK